MRWLSYRHQTHRHPANNNRCSLSNLLQPRSWQSPSSYPPFWPADPLVWFAQIEAQFATRNITNQQTRFDYVVAGLSNEYATEICDLILNPPREDAYSTLKDLLIKRTAASERKHLLLLFTAEELGDRKPTQLLRRMQQLMGDAAGPNLDNSFLRELFFQRLPSHVRMVLASSGDNVSLDILADMADKIMEAAIPTVTSVTSPAIPVGPATTCPYLLRGCRAVSRDQ